MGKLNNKDLQAAMTSYTQENRDAGGYECKVTLEEDFDDHVKWTDSWDDGVPVTKGFDRNDEVPLFIPKGQVLWGVAYRGRATGVMVFDFYYGSTWYSVEGAEGLLGIDTEEDEEEEDTE